VFDVLKSEHIKFVLFGLKCRGGEGARKVFLAGRHVWRFLGNIFLVIHPHSPEHV
jgi:hypothetical protein